ncbi:hypothetical protein JG688_00018183 [Phytophthora aleatoria]|uniref:Uncharacterized protein n=1 Tax=Phytophthora aleatoria TaxID=2496075 RepID=A0A8J5MBP2_9STRA|nr:hypothetical protein JG688_00018183 [Phytophthora aleatoria]
MRMTCRHIFAALRDRGQQAQAIRVFHSACLVRTYCVTFADKSIASPVRDAPPSDSILKPSPYYKQAGRPVQSYVRS